MANTALPKDVDDYIARFPDEVQAKLKAIRSVIRSAAPAATEVISYGMPAYKQHGYVALFAGYKKHIGMYGMITESNQQFVAELAPYATEKGTLKFPYDQPLPLKLIGKLVRNRVKDDKAHAKTKG